ncbi:HOMEOBOX-LEUCINE ZIPPER PROTEIN HAT9-LIKE [Salix viminalis]|uniref:HOMEOBOX-LEUCINE ZIPPER PROTEIN HAT9-LIKE n=1 Tax=Salix viminalis TaxID=40686 RepID=A0A9Q0V6F3_SALVM|nr:HOMEOBOX-LEUCINE ZIPPER PROTEIN HAT9-LIKE [Salix viminalis]
MEEDGYCNTKLGLGLGGETYVPWPPQKQKEKPVVRLDLSFKLCPDQQDSMKIDYHGKAEGTRFRSEEDEECGNKKRSDRSIDDNSCMYDAGRKKLRLTKDQSSYLEETFQRHPALNPAKKHALAEQLNLKPRQVEVWFQNRRARTKLKQTEADYEVLKKCCESLSNENRRLKREVQELRSQKSGRSSSSLHSQLAKDGTATKCPSCEESTTTDQKNW